MKFYKTSDHIDRDTVCAKCGQEITPDQIKNEGFYHCHVDQIDYHNHDECLENLGYYDNEVISQQEDEAETSDSQYEYTVSLESDSDADDKYNMVVKKEKLPF